ncbi:MAG: D-2-hydroxyacid dehydrogenase family protein [Dehalococcoidia bacterium]|jgi:phosphoglycerate dehydrogenase-like enzyme|nr:D-2-hydroxyacid dehydrogenase family protein [Dehalococcoidia bacterium]
MSDVRIAVLDDYWHIAEGAADWSSLDGASFDFYHDTLIDPAAIVERLKPYDAVVTTRERTRFPAEVLEGLTNLKVIAGTGARQANVDLEKASELGITVCNTSGSRGRGNSTAELTWALVLGVTRHIAWEDRQMREGRWQTRQAEGLGGKKLGILGIGRLGTIVAGYGNHFDMDVIAWGPTLDAERAAANGVELVSWDGLFSESDILSIHVPLTDLSRGWVTAREFGLMKPSSYLVNTSRGPIVDESALIAALRDGQIAGAALDVYDVEPVQAGHPLLTLDNVLLAPHLGYSTVSTVEGFMKLSLENLREAMPRLRSGR